MRDMLAVLEMEKRYYEALKRIEKIIGKITIADGNNLKKHQEVLQEIIEVIEEVS